MFIADCPSIPGCVSQGKTEEEAERNIRQAIKECLEVREERGLPLTVTTRESALWADREDMKDPSVWVRKIREPQYPHDGGTLFSSPPSKPKRKRKTR
jgi:predicted RNase H-like HicB family nuclease